MVFIILGLLVRMEKFKDVKVFRLRLFICKMVELRFEFRFFYFKMYVFCVILILV